MTTGFDPAGGTAVAVAPSPAWQPPLPPRSKPTRKASTKNFSLANIRLAAGEQFVTPEGNLSPGYLQAKRAMDVVGALALLIVLGPIMLLTFLVLLVTTRGKPFYRQQRLGYRGRPFMMIKFRTMTLDAEQRQHEVVNQQDGPIFKNRADNRITRIGRLLRRTSIDETPQLFNILAGHMALVGPRPPLGSEVARYAAWQRRRLSVKPGLTCLWQISGRSEIGFLDWARMDLWYVRNQCFATDLVLLVRTPVSVLSRRGAY